LSRQTVTKGSLVLKAAGQAGNTGTDLLTAALISVNFKEASGTHAPEWFPMRADGSSSRLIRAHVYR
jgi:hypothetical protein